jgi:threonine dehydrogenase-like Zn-dependent dehydrogenase
VDGVGPGVDLGLVGTRCVGDNILAAGGEVGFEHPGGYSEYLVTEADKLYVLPDGYPLATATLIEPLAVAVRSVRRLRVGNRASALVLGDGPIGQLVLMLLLSNGVKRVVMVGGRRRRLEMAAGVGAAATVNYHEAGPGVASALQAALRGSTPNIVETSGSAAAIETAIALAAPRGRIVIVGDYRGSCASFRWNDMLHREFELAGSNSGSGAWPQAVRLATRGGLPVSQLITHRLPAHRFAQGVALARGRRGDVVKVVLEW